MNLFRLNVWPFTGKKDIMKKERRYKMKVKKIIKIIILIIITILTFCFIMKNFFPAEWSFITPHKQGDFVRVGNMQLKGRINASALLDNGDVLLLKNGQLEIYKHKTRKFELIKNDLLRDIRVTNFVRLNNDDIFLTCKKQGKNDRTYIYKPNTNIFNNGPELLEERYAHNLTLLENGKVFISGGYNKNNAAKAEKRVSNAEYYNPKTNKIEQGPLIEEDIFDFNVISYDKNSILLIGGFVFKNNNLNVEPNQDIFLINISNNVVSKIGVLSVKRERQDIFKLCSGDIIIMQGIYNPGNIANEIEVYNPKNHVSAVVGKATNDKRIANTAHLFRTTQPWLNAALLPNDKILFFGGKSSNIPFNLFYKETDVYDIRTNTFAVLNNKTNCFYNRTDNNAILLKDNNLLLLNSENNGKCSEIYIIN